jgi:cell fate regulator YaaT (PSP1 superfamily)
MIRLQEVHPKRILSKATPTDLQLLASKAADESKALTLCRGKVIQKNLEMEITDAEWQFGEALSCSLVLVSERLVQTGAS